MTNSVIGALRITLGINTAAFEKGLNEAQRKLNRFGKDFQQIGKGFASVGASMTRGITLPIIGAAAAVGKLAGDFEAAMNRVEAATGASGKQLKALRDQAKAFGADKTLPATATDAANAMEMLAKNGLTATQIMEGAGEATLRLAAATGGDFSKAADLATDIVQQFGKKASELPGIVDKVTGSLLVSKFGFEDYAAAIGQAGGVAGGLGVSFEDMNTAIAATAALFSSGSDAGTSFKTFITALTGNSKEAKDTIKALGLQFFDTAGNIKPLADIAEELRLKVSGLNKEAQTEVLKKIFGTDAIRTAIGLMGQGAAGMAKLNAEINKASASEQAAIRMKGFAGGLQQLKKAAEQLAIAIGDSGVLEWMAKVVTAVADMLRALSQLPSPLLRLISIFAGVAAAVGPVLFVVGKLIGVWGSLLRWTVLMAPQWAAVRAGFMAWVASSTLATAALGRLATAMRFLMGPWGIAIMAIAAALIYLHRAATGAAGATAQVERTAQAATKAVDAYEAAALKAASASGAARASALAEAAALRVLAEQAIKTARAELALAQARLANARAEMVKPVMGITGSAGSVSGTIMGKSNEAARADTDVKRLKGVIEEAQATLDTANAALSAAANATASTAGAASGGSSFSMPEDDAASRKRREKDLAARREIMKLQVDLQAAQLRGDIDEERRLQRLLDIRQRQADWEEAGLKTQQAKLAALADQARLDAALAESNQRELDTDEIRRDLQIAEINGDYVAIRQAQDKLELADRINYYRQQGLTLIEATSKALDDQAQKEGAIADATKRRMDESERARQISLARLRGDTDAQVRSLEQSDWITRRTDQIGSDSGGRVNAADALAQAQREAAEENKAYHQGYWRSVFQGGFRAALDGNFGDWFEGWWKDRVANALEKALNSLADLIADLFSKAANNNGGGGFDSLLSSLASLFGGGGGKSAGLANAIGSKVQGFASGGSFQIGGLSGIDRNILSLNNAPIAKVSRGEIARIGKANDNSGSIAQIIPSPYFDVVVDGRVVSTGGQMMQQSSRSTSRRAKQSLLGVR